MNVWDFLLSASVTKGASPYVFLRSSSAANSRWSNKSIFRQRRSTRAEEKHHEIVLKTAVANNLWSSERGFLVGLLLRRSQGTDKRLPHTHAESPTRSCYETCFKASSSLKLPKSIKFQPQPLVEHLFALDLCWSSHRLDMLYKQCGTFKTVSRLLRLRIAVSKSLKQYSTKCK